MRARLVPAVLTTLLLVVAACSDGGDEDIGADGGSDDGGETNGEQLVAAMSGRPDQLDPHVTTAYASFQVLENVYDTLVVPNPDDLTFEPSLATEWTPATTRSPGPSSSETTSRSTTAPPSMPPMSCTPSSGSSTRSCPTPSASPPSSR